MIPERFPSMIGEEAAKAGVKVLAGAPVLEKGMEESAQAAMSYIRSRSKVLGLEDQFYQTIDVHVHFPDFVRKDGPSAGVTMATSIASALTRIPVRHDVAMTGEITLRGRVLPIGGVKEKLLAAHLAGIKTVILPQSNEANLEEVPEAILADLTVIPVSGFHEVLDVMLVKDDSAPASFVPPLAADDASSGASAGRPA